MLKMAVRIRSHLLLLTAVVLVPTLLAASIAVTKVRDAERETALRGLRETVRATSLMVDGEVQRSLGALGQSHHLQTGDFAALYGQAAAVDRKPDVWTLVLDDTGTQRINTSVPYGTPLPPPVALQRVIQVLQTQRPFVSDLIAGPVTGQLLTTLYVPAKASAIGSFVVAQAFSVDHWKMAAMRPQGRSQWIVAVIDRTGRFIWRSHRTEEFVGKFARPELTAAAAASPDGLIRHSTLEGIEAYDAFTHSALTGWTVAVAAPVPTIEASATEAVVWLAAGVAMAFAVALLGATLLGRVLLRAIGTASDAARSLGRGDTPQSPRTAVSEVNALNSALGDAAHLLAQERELRKGVEQQRQQLLENERLARETAEQENKAKDKFLALLGHELRNPMAAISGASDVLARSQADAAVRAKFIAVIQRQNGHMVRIVDDLLEVSRMLSGKIELRAHALDLAQCVRNCIEALRVTDRGSQHRWDGLTEEVWVHGDPVRLEQIINNLAVNALHFSPPNGEIAIVVIAETSHAVIEVSDGGPGIAPDLLPRIFEPFVQGPPPAGRQAGGLGIGLALVKQLVELHGGEIAVRRGRQGLGSTFSVRFPRIARPQSRTLNSALALPTTVSRVLLVDDHLDAREATAQLMRSMGFAVTEAGDGDAALKAALLQVPDVVVMDLELPNKSGYLIAAEMRAVPSLRHVPLIVLSGYGQPQDRAASLDAGFAVHLVKPVAIADLAHAIEAQITG